MPTRISQSEFDNIMDQVSAEDVNMAFTHHPDGSNCMTLGTIHVGKNCRWKGVDLTMDDTVCPLTYSGSKDKAAATVTAAEKKLADHATRRVAHTSGFPIFGGTTLSKNTASASLRGAINIKDALFQECATSKNLVNSFYCDNSQLDNVVIKQGHQSDTVENCLSKQTDHSRVYQDLISTIAQTEVNKTESSLYIWEGVVLLLGTILAILALLTGEIPWKLRLVMLIIIAMITIFALYWVIKKYDKKHVIQWCPDCTLFKDEGSCMGSMCYWDTGVTPHKCRCDGTKTDCSVQCPLFFSESDCKKNHCGWNTKSNTCTGDPMICKDPAITPK